MTNTLVGPVRATLAKAKKDGPTLMFSARGGEIILTKNAYDRAIKKTGILVIDAFSELDASNYGPDFSDDNNNDYLELPDTTIKAIKKAIDNPVTVYEVTDDDGEGWILTEAEYKAIKPTARVYTFYALGYDCTLTADRLKVGCQTHPLKYWEQHAGALVRQNIGSVGSDSYVGLVADVMPTLKELQATLTQQARRKSASKSKAKTTKKRQR